MSFEFIAWNVYLLSDNMDFHHKNHGIMKYVEMIDATKVLPKEVMLEIIAKMQTTNWIYNHNVFLILPKNL